METSLDSARRESPERRILRVVARLRSHALWDSLLVFAPPLIVFIYLAVQLYRDAWMAQTSFLLLSVVIIGAGFLAVVVRYRPLRPSVSSTARLIDERIQAKDRVLTLATLEASLWPSWLVARLRGEAATLLDRIDLQREFPYRIKRSFYWSLSGSLLAALLFHFLLLVTGRGAIQGPAHDELRSLADKMTQRPVLSALARDLQTLAMKLQDPAVSEQEKQTLIQEAREKLEEQKKKEAEKENQDLLGETSNTLQSLEQQLASSQPREQERGGGGIQSNLPQKGQEESKQSQESGGDGEGESKAQKGDDSQQGKSAQGDPKEEGKEKNQRPQGEGQGNQPDPSKTDKEGGRELAAKSQGGLGEKASKSRSEEIPQGEPPAERFNKPGEGGKEGIKGARYVTVQLPEEVAADARGEGSKVQESKPGKARAKVPVSNVPLPPHVPGAPTEKQQLPLEYRGIIR
jgi:hypothetical protein